MHFFASLSSLSICVALSSAAAINRRTADQDTPATAAPISRFGFGVGENILRPIHIDTFRSAAGLHVRDVTDFSRLDLIPQADLIFGAPTENGNILLANMTLYAPDGQLIVMMEGFDGLTSAVDCKGDDGSMSLTFKSKDAFDAAAQKWSVINEKDEDSFLLIANHDGCGPEDQRQAYTISKVTNDEVNLITTLAAKTAPWSEIAGTFDMNFGSTVVAPGATRRLLVRGFFDDLKNAAGDVVNQVGDTVGDVVDGAKDVAGDIVDGAGQAVDTVTDGVKDAAGAVSDTVSDVVADVGSGEISKEVTFDVTVGQQGQRFNVLTDPISTVPTIVVDCIDCFITGKFKVAGSLSVTNFQVQELTLNASPQDFQSKLELEATISASVAIAPPSLNLTKEIASFPIPGAGIVVPGIFELGAVVSYEVAVESSIAGTANFTFGLVTSLPNTASIVANIVNVDASSATGFDGVTFDPIFEINSGSATLNIGAVSRPKLTFGVDVVGVGKLEAGLNFGLPRVDTALTVAFDQAGVCDQTAGASKTGFNVASNVTIALDFSVNGKFGPGQILDAGTLFSVNLFKFVKPLFTKCFPIDIPGLNSVSAKRDIGY